MQNALLDRPASWRKTCKDCLGAEAISTIKIWLLWAGCGPWSVQGRKLSPPPAESEPFKILLQKKIAGVPAGRNGVPEQRRRENEANVFVHLPRKKFSDEGIQPGLQ